MSQRCQEIKDRKHDAFMHKYHLIDLLRMSKFTLWPEEAAENWKITSIHLTHRSSLYKNGLVYCNYPDFYCTCAL